MGILLRQMMLGIAGDRKKQDVTGSRLHATLFLDELTESRAAVLFFCSNQTEKRETEEGKMRL